MNWILDTCNCTFGVNIGMRGSLYYVVLLVVRNLVNYVYVGKWMPSFPMLCFRHFFFTCYLLGVNSYYSLMNDLLDQFSQEAGRTNFFANYLRLLTTFQSINAVCPRERNVIKNLVLNYLNSSQNKEKRLPTSLLVMHYDFTKSKKVKRFFFT